MSSDSGPSNPPARTWMGKLDEVLQQQNFVTDGLQKIEDKTNIKKRYIALGKLFPCPLVHEPKT